MEVVERLATATAPALLLDSHPDPDHNRTVVTICGLPANVEEGLLAAVAEAIRSIDLRRHQGVHPRVGAADVVPLVPLRGSLDAAAEDARRLAARIWGEVGLPVYLYGPALAAPSLADIRAGRARLAFGTRPHPSAGAVCVGARPPLVAYNILLPGASAGAARALAAELRASAPTGLPGVQALAFGLADGTWQLSMNLFDLARTPPAAVLAEVGRRWNRPLGPDEVVGLCPVRHALPAARGRLLEAREAAAVARAAGRPELAAELASTAPDAAGIGRARALLDDLPDLRDPQLETVREHAEAGLRGAPRS